MSRALAPRARGKRKTSHGGKTEDTEVGKGIFGPAFFDRELK
jgi:hypothetical protein